TPRVRPAAPRAAAGPGRGAHRRADGRVTERRLQADTVRRVAEARDGAALRPRIGRSAVLHCDGVGAQSVRRSAELAAPPKVVKLRKESAKQPLGRKSWRKVRAPLGRVPGNAWEARAYGKCHRKYTAGRKPGKGEKVR